MEKKRQNIFTNDEWFAAFTAVMAAAGGLEGILCFTTKSVTFVMVPLVAVMGLFMFKAYKSHQKNMMKGLIGACLMWMLYEEVDFAGAVLVSERSFFISSLEGAYTFFSILKILNVILILVIFFLHFRINSEHHSRPVEIRVNQILNLQLIVFYAVDIATQLFFGEISASQIVLMFFKTVLMFMVISIESRLDEYRIIRETKQEPAQIEQNS